MQSRSHQTFIIPCLVRTCVNTRIVTSATATFSLFLRGRKPKHRSREKDRRDTDKARSNKNSEFKHVHICPFSSLNLRPKRTSALVFNDLSRGRPASVNFFTP